MVLQQPNPNNWHRVPECGNAHSGAALLPQPALGSAPVSAARSSHDFSGLVVPQEFYGSLYVTNFGGVESGQGLRNPVFVDRVGIALVIGQRITVRQ